MKSLLIIIPLFIACGLGIAIAIILIKMFKDLEKSLNFYSEESIEGEIEGEPWF